MRRVATASFIGTAIEFYDYYIYGTAAALVLDEAFFPELSRTAGTLATLSTFAIGFAARPLGAAVFGHFGDRVGRKGVLVVSLLMMGLSTGLIGLLPGYATLGVWAPVLLVLLRVVQGLGLGGEWGGAALLAVEHAPQKKRGLYAAAPQMGSPVGYFAATVTFLVMSSVLDDGAFQSWGWRIPFLLSFVLVAVAVLGAATFFVARWSDRVGRRKLIIAGAAFGVVWGAVLFPLLDTRNYFLIAVALSGALLCMGIIYGPAGAYLPELFATRVRYSGAGFSYNLGGVLGGAAAPHSPCPSTWREARL
nr:MFS transporter [Streptomyces liliiviolaceus]